MAAELGPTSHVARRGGLLHDIGKAIDHEMEGTHLQIGADLLRKYGETERGRPRHGLPPRRLRPAARSRPCWSTAADALSAARPGARREMLETYVQRLEKLEEIASGFPGVEKTFAIQAGREIRVIVDSRQDRRRAGALAVEGHRPQDRGRS